MWYQVMNKISGQEYWYYAPIFYKSYLKLESSYLTVNLKVCKKVF